MSLIFTETFTGVNASQQATAGKYLTVLQAYIQVGSGGRTPGTGYMFGNGSYGAIRRTVNAAEEHATFIAGGAFRTSSTWAYTSEQTLIELSSDNGTRAHVTVTLDTARGIGVWRGPSGGALLGRSAANLGLAVPNVYYYVEVRATLGDGTNGSVAVMVDGTQVINLTGIDTNNAGTKTVFDTVFWAAALGSWGISDLYICNGAGSTNNDFLVAPLIYGLRPNGNGASSAGVGSDGNSTDNYALVDDAGTGTSDWVDLINTGDEDSYAVTDVSGIPTSTVVKGAMVWSNAQKTDAAERGLSHVARSGANETVVPAATPLVNGTFGYTASAIEAKPGGGAWTVADLNAMEFGIRAT